MKKKDAITSSIKLDKVEGSWEDHPSVQFLMQYGRTALIALLGIIAITFLIYRLTLIGKEQEEIDFWNAEKEFQVFTNPNKILEAEEALINLNGILKSNPELYAKYDGLIGQTLINRGDAGDAMPFVTRTLSRTDSENQPYYTNYTQTTLLMTEQRYDEALKQAISLDTQMRQAINQPEAERKFGDTLFAFNLLRVGILQQQLGLQEEELKTWQEWKQYLTASPLAKTFQQQAAILSEGKASLEDYIDARIAKLKK